MQRKLPCNIVLSLFYSCSHNFIPGSLHVFFFSCFLYFFTKPDLPSLWSLTSRSLKKVHTYTCIYMYIYTYTHIYIVYTHMYTYIYTKCLGVSRIFSLFNIEYILKDLRVHIYIYNYFLNYLRFNSLDLSTLFNL